MGSTFLHHLPLFLSFFVSAATGSLGARFSGIFVEALAFGMGCLPAGLLTFKPGLMAAGFSGIFVEALAFGMGCLPASLLTFKPALMAAAEPYSFFSTTLLEVASSSAT